LIAGGMDWNNASGSKLLPLLDQAIHPTVESSLTDEKITSSPIVAPNVNRRTSTFFSMFDFSEEMLLIGS